MNGVKIKSGADHAANTNSSHTNVDRSAQQTQNEEATLRASQNQRSELKSTLLGDLDRQRQHVLKQIENSHRNDNSSNRPDQIPNKQSPVHSSNEGENRHASEYQREIDHTDHAANSKALVNSQSSAQSKSVDHQLHESARQDVTHLAQSDMGAKTESQRSPTLSENSLTPIQNPRGEDRGKNLSPDAQRLLDAVSEMLGRDRVGEVMDRHSRASIEKFVAHILSQADQLSARPSEFIDAANRELPQRSIEQLAAVLQLAGHFAQLEEKGGEVVRRAENAVWQLLVSEKPGEQSHQTTFSPWELLRDLRSSAFLPAQELSNPFPLTGRARVVSEMMELLRTLDALERIMQQQQGRTAVSVSGGLETMEASALMSRMANGAEVSPEEMLGSLLGLPMLPGRAGRAEMLRFMAALNQPLTDAQGRVLLNKEGVALKPNELLWLNIAGGRVASEFSTELFPAHLSPTLIHSFDAVYSLIGFDGRSLAATHFVAVQAQVNASDLEWVFGQPPLTEGWTRALIERLKDSAPPDYNLLGEMLEEALLDGRFHTVLFHGAVEDGIPVAQTFSITQILPGASGDLSFA